MKQCRFLTSFIRFFLCFLFISISTISAQSFLVPYSGMDSTALCNGTITDHAGTGSYSNNANGVFKIQSSGPVTLTFTSFSTENCCDRLYIYDGNNINAPLIGSYRGSALPNGGTVTSTSNGVTLRFTTDGSSTRSGFSATWGANSTTNPTAGFNVANTSVPYNTDILFTNATLNGGTYLWMFGDGATSTLVNPTHRYTTTGTKNVRLVATNCLGSDTSSVTLLTVQSAPIAALSVDTVNLTLACGTSGSASFNISNTGSGNLNYSLNLLSNAAYNSFSESFENGLGNFVNGNSNYTVTFPSSNAPDGSNYLTMAGSDFSNPVKANFNSEQPSTISYYVRSDTYANYHGQFEVNSQVSGLKEYLFYSVFRYNNLRIYYYNVNLGYSTYQNVPQTDLTWYHVELRNVNWTAKTYDIYVNNVLQITGAGFYTQSLTSVNEFSFTNNYFSTTSLDGVYLDGLNANNIFSYNPKSGNLGNNSNNSIFVNANTTGLNAGTYYFDFFFSSNDTILDSLLLPLVLEVIGDPIVFTDKSCTNFGNVYTAIDYKDSLMISNLGCDTLNISSISGNTSFVTITNASFDLAPNDTVYYSFNYNTSVLGTFSDTLIFSGPDTTFSYCITGNASAAPSITLNSNSFVVNHTGCGDSASFQMVIGNTGLDTLFWSDSGLFNQSVADDFESGTFSAIWGTVGTGVSLTSQSCGVIAGTNSLVFDGFTDRKLNTTSLNLTAGGTIEFDMQRTTFCNWPESNDGINLEYSLDNGTTWVTISYLYFNSSTATRVVEQIPAAAQRAGVQIRLFQRFHSGTTDVWLVDNFNVNSSFSNEFTFLPDTGVVAINAYDTVTVFLPTAGLNTGVYNLSGFISSNDPINNPAPFNVTLNLTGVPNLVAQSNCVALDTVVMNTSVSDSVMVYNNGCGDLNISSVTTQSTLLFITNPPSLLAPGDTAFLYYTFSPALGPLNFVDTIQIVSNDTLRKICVNAFVESAPTINVTPANLALTHIGCSDSANFQLVVGNSGLNNLNYRVSSASNLLLTDDFESGSFNANLWSATSSSANVNNSCGVVNGSYSLTFSGSGIRSITSVPLDLTSGGVLSLSIQGRGTCEPPDFGEGVFLEYSVDNGNNWFSFYYHYTNSSVTQFLSESIPVLAQTNSTRLRISQVNFTVTTGDNWIIDDVTVQSTGVNAAIYFTPDTNSLAINSFDTINGYININGFSSGVHIINVYIASNDPLTPEISIPITLTVIGAPEVQSLKNGCVTFANVQQGATALDSVFITNTGCDTLFVNFANSNLSEFSVQGLPLSIMPGDTAFVEILFNPLTVGTFLDTMNFNSNDTAFAVCLNGSSIGAPILSLPEDTLEFTLNKCKVIGNKNFKIDNSGLGAMTYSMSFGGFSASSKQTYNTSGASTIHSFTGLPALATNDTIEIKVILHGDYDDFNERSYMNIDGVYNTGYLNDQNLNYTNDTITYTFYGNNPVNWTSDNNLNITVFNTTQVDGATGSFHEVLIRLTSQVNWVSVIGSISGTVSANGSTNKNILFNAALLPVGTYNTNLRITNNGLSDPIRNVPVIFNVVAEPEILATDSCLNFPITLLGDTATKTFSVYNSGCAVLNVASVTSTNNAFKIVGSTGVSAVQIGDSLHYTVNFIPTVVGSFSASILVISNGELINVCLTGVAGALPVSAFNISPENSCKGEFSFIDASQFNPSSYFWQFGDGSTSTLSNPTHTYTKPGTYQVSLRVNNTYGFDTITKTVTANPLYTNFGASNNFIVEQDSAITFSDSSLTATSWAWNFGDGNTSTMQNPTHTYVTKGTYNVTLTVNDTRGCSQSISKNVFVAYSIGLDEDVTDLKLYIYPNPAADYFKLKTNLHISSIKIFDATGKVVYQQELKNEVNKEYIIETSKLSSGIYFIRIFNAKGVSLGVERLSIGK